METGALGRREAHKRSRIKEAAISRRQNLQEWQVSRPFQTEDMNRFPVIRSGFPMKDIFKLSDDHKALFSIDITTKNREIQICRQAAASCSAAVCASLLWKPQTETRHLIIRHLARSLRQCRIYRLTFHRRKHCFHPLFQSPPIHTGHPP